MTEGIPIELNLIIYSHTCVFLDRINIHLIATRIKIHHISTYFFVIYFYIHLITCVVGLNNQMDAIYTNLMMDLRMSILFFYYRSSYHVWY
jgi:hypothetical protein